MRIAVRLYLISGIAMIRDCTLPPPGNREFFMQQFQRDFIDFTLDIEALRFGQFELKSGRLSPYFFNSGLFNSGGRLMRLATAYAKAIQESGLEYDVMFGPAYKGIPLVAAIAGKLYDNFGVDVPYSFNRKEAKDHGEGGVIVGAELKGRVLIVDDVISAGTSVRESLALIEAAEAEAIGVAISLDRQERGTGTRSAIQEVQDDYGLSVVNIICLDDLVEFIESSTNEAHRRWLEDIKAYREQYGV